MADNIKDLVVRLSFQHGDTRSQISSIKNEIKLLDSGFKAAAAAAGGFSDDLNTAAVQADTLRKQMELQAMAVEKYSKAIDESKKRLQDAQTRQKEYSEAITEARTKQAALKKEKTDLIAAMAKEKKANGDNSMAYLEMDARLDALNESLADNDKALKNAEKGYARADQAVANADKSVQKLTIAQNEAKAVQAGLKTQLDALDGSYSRHSGTLMQASASLRAYSDAAIKAGQAQQRAGQALNKGTTAIVAAGVAAGGAAVGWEDDFAGVRKTVNGTAEDLAKIEEGLLDMGEDISASYEDLAGIAENAGQLGIQTKNVLGFTRTMADLAETTDLTADAASEGFAQYANITGMAQENIGRLGSVTVMLGNNLATTESKTLSFAQRIAAAGKQAGMSDAKIFALAGGMSSLGLEAEAGGTAFSKAISSMQVAVETGNDDLEKYATVAGMTASSFADAFRKDAAGAFISFVQGLSSGSQSAIAMLDEMGITEVRMRDALLRASNASDLLTGSIEMANKAWEENSALTAEASVRYGTNASRLKILGNRMQRTAITFGKSLTPVLESGMEAVDNIVDKFAALDEEQRKNILTWAAYAAAVGPAVTLVGKGNTMLGTAAGKFADVAAAMAKADSPLKGLFSGVKNLLGPMGIAVLTGALVVGAGAFLSYASGAQEAKQAMEDMIDVAQEWKNTQAETIYDQGNGDPLGRFGLSADDFANGRASAESWIDELIKVWTDGERETSEQVKYFSESFASASDSIREKIEARGNLLDGLGTLDEGTKSEMDADLKQLDAWDKEVKKLLKKRRGGYLTEKEEARLNEVIQLRAELELEYSAGDGSGYEQVLAGMRAEIDRTEQQGLAIDPGLYGDALNALADGRKSYMDALDASYDSQHKQIMAIEDETQRTAALAALNEQYNAQRLEGEEPYQQAVADAGAQAWTDLDMESQITALNELATLLGSDTLDLTAIANWTKEIDEGSMASAIALIEQLKASGADESVLAEMGIDAEGLLSTIQQIKDIADSTEGLEGLATMFGKALPEEIQRVLIGLDMTQAAADWELFFADKKSFTTEGHVNITMTNIDQTMIENWEKENSSIAVTGPTAKVGLSLGANWQSALKAAFDNGVLQVYGTNGMAIPVTPEILSMLDGNDLIALDEDGTYHVIVTPELGSTEAFELSFAKLTENPLEHTPIAALGSTTQSNLEGVLNAYQTVIDAQRQYEEALASGDFNGLDPVMVDPATNGAISGLVDLMNQLSDADMAALATEAANLMAALAGGGLDEATATEYTGRLQSILELVAAADQYLGTGNQVSAGIAQGMNEYGWDGDATTLASTIQAAINTALGISSPAVSMIPTGGYAAAGIAKGMLEHDFSEEAAGVAGNVKAGFTGFGDDGRSIGKDFGSGLCSGLESTMKDALAIARSYAARITATIKSAWQIHSPSRVAEGLTEMFGAGLERGMENWPTVSERMLDTDILNARRGIQQAVNNDNRDFSSSSSVTIQRMNVRSDDDIQQIARELAALIRREQKALGG